MTDLKSRKYAEKHGLNEKLTLNPDTGVWEVSEDFFSPVLEEVGIEPKQLEKFQKRRGEHMAAATLVAGEKAAAYFEQNPEVKELSMSYDMGHDQASVHFNRNENITSVRNEVSVHGAQDKGELKKVHKYVDGLFDDISS